jgi:hypothetical protein
MSMANPHPVDRPEWLVQLKPGTDEFDQAADDLSKANAHFRQAKDAFDKSERVMNQAQLDHTTQEDALMAARDARTAALKRFTGR